MMMVVSFVSWMIHIYTIGYMRDERTKEIPIPTMATQWAPAHPILRANRPATIDAIKGARTTPR